MRPSAHPRLHAFLTSHAAVFLLYALITLPFLLLQDLTILHSDDWGFLNDMRMGMSPLPDIGNSRVLFPTFWSTMYAMFDSHLAGTYVVIRIAQVLFAFSIYFVLRMHGMMTCMEAVLAGLLVLFAPGDHSREWWTMGHPWFATGFGFGTFLILTAMYVRDRQPWLLYLATAILLVSFGLFEIHLGLVTFVVLVLIFTERQHTDRQVGPLIVLVLALCLYAVLHAWQGIALEVRDNRVTAVQFDLQLLLSHYIKGFTLLVKSWGAPLLARSSMTSAAASFATLGSTAVVLVTTAVLIGRRSTPNDGIQVSRMHAVTLSLISIPLAFLPIILVMPPSGNDIDARTLMLASPATTVSLALLISWFARRVTLRQSSCAVVFSAGMLPLIVVGMVDHVDRLDEHRRAWSVQKDMWYKLSRSAPRLQPHTHVIILLENDVPGRLASARPMFGAGYHTLTGALQLLRNDPTLSGGILSIQRIADTPTFMRSLKGPVASTLHWPLPFVRTAVFRYDARARQLDLLSRPELEKRWGLALPAYNPYTRIDTNGVNTSPWRALIE